MISIIVTDYLRKIYILNALKSIKEQKGIKLNDLELVVVKYYKDKNIDNYINSFPNHKNITLNPNGPHHVGYTDAIGLERASSDIIFFCEDDDYFAKYKLNKILDYIKFIKGNNYGVLHKQIAFLDNDSQNTKSKINYERCPWHNLSSWVLKIDDEAKKRLIRLYQKTYFATDWALYYFFTRFYKLYRMEDRLTYLRIHSNNTSLIRNKEKSRGYIKDYERLYSIFKDRRLKKWLWNEKLFSNVEFDSKYAVGIRDMPFGLKYVIKYTLYKLNKPLFKKILKEENDICAF